MRIILRVISFCMILLCALYDGIPCRAAEYDAMDGLCDAAEALEIPQDAEQKLHDAGESALSSAVTLTGKVTLILLALPLFRPLLSMLREVLSCVSSFG